MTEQEMRALKVGDLVRHKRGAEAYMVAAHYGERVTLVRTGDMTNPGEWDRVTEFGGVLSSKEIPR